MKNKIIVFVFLTILIIFGIGTAVMDDREYSPMENRYLQQKPKCSKKALLDGTYMKDTEKYLADQVVFKDALVKLKTDTEKLLHQQESGGVYFGKKGYYVQKYQTASTGYEHNLRLLNAFAKKHKDTHTVAMLLAPNVQSVMKNILPQDIVMGDAKKDVKKAEEKLTDMVFVNPVDNLKKHNAEALYFKTDHHWTMRGAYYAYESLAQAMHWEYQPLKSYRRSVVSESFYGSLYSKAPLSWAKPDPIEVFANPQGRYQVTFETGKRIDSLFLPSNLYGKDKYTYFLDGNHPFLTIKSNVHNGKKALVLKDSYSHALLPFLADQYEEIAVVDLRYYRKSIKTLLEEGGYQDILCIYNLDFLTTDGNFIWLEEP